MSNELLSWQSAPSSDMSQRCIHFSSRSACTIRHMKYSRQDPKGLQVQYQVDTSRQAHLALGIQRLTRWQS